MRPTIELKQVRGLNVRVPELPTPERDPIEAHLEELRIAQAQQVEEPEGTAAARGHLAVIQYQARAAGEAVDGEPAPREITVELGSDRSFPGLEEQLEGMVVDQQRSFELPAPGAPESAGEGEKRIAFEVRLVGLRRRELAELDDEFAKDVSEFETLDALRADLARRVEEGREAEKKRLLREATIDAVTEANPFPLPNGMVERQLSGRIARAVSQFRGQVPPEELGKRVERWRTEWRAQAERDVRLALLVPEIAKAEQLRVSPEDIEAQLGKLAEEQGTSADVLRQRFTDHGLLDALEGGLLEQCVVEFLGSQATLLET